MRLRKISLQEVQNAALRLLFLYVVFCLLSYLYTSHFYA